MWTLSYQIAFCLLWVKLCNFTKTTDTCHDMKVFGVNSETQMTVVRGCPGGVGGPGIKGEVGNVGFKGSNGSLGRAGKRGQKGDEGVSGVPGEGAIPGTEGVKGSKGQKGEISDLSVIELKHMDEVNCKGGPKSCKDLLQKGITLSGIYTLYFENCRTMNVLCDMDTDGGGWLVFQRRWDGSVEFYQTWNTYKRGFGNLMTEFWLGNDNLNKITAIGSYELRVDLRDFENHFFYAKYKDFKIAGELEKYRLSIGNFTEGNAGDSLSIHHNMPFTTRDQDNDPYEVNCAHLWKGAWWYKACYICNLNGWYMNSIAQEGVTWWTAKKNYYSFQSTEMKFRPI
ncbi:ficolin-2-like [Ambystoma mexicanum]|uniref:ficolin-2-like n=1 Tax=Ambystoma mexicanum TaxID=8296 RepID=UPI0037E76DDC